MKKTFVKRWLAYAVACIVLGGCFSGTAQAKDWDVVRGETDYYVNLENSSNVFVCNKGTVGSQVGTEYYMTYTVESIQAKSFDVNGIMGTNQPRARYPYVASEDGQGGGILNFQPGDDVLKEGMTYFIKFTITEDGYTYRMSWAKDEESGYIKFGSVVGEHKDETKYFGVWLGSAEMSGKLTRVRIYDKKGNDLGVQATPGRNVSVGREETFKKDSQVNHRYTIELKDVYDIAISNFRTATSDKIFMEYRVASSDSKVYQVGGSLSNEPKAAFPYLTGQLLYMATDFDANTVDDGPFLVEGAEYLFIFEKKTDYFDVIAQRTYKGKTEIISLDSTYGTYDKEADFVSLWFGGGREMLTNAVLEDFKCYDSNKNNLGVQCNQKNVKITHFGELEEYTDCEAVYYCKEDGSLYALYEDQTLKYTSADVNKQGTYTIEERMMKVSIDNTTKDFDYVYLRLTDDTGKEYERLHTYKVIFETGKGTEVETQIVDAKNGYQAMRPTDPTMENNQFEGWYTSDGREYDFDTLVTESVTLHAKWAKADYASIEGGTNYTPYLYVGSGILIFLIFVAAGIVIVKKGGKHERGN